MSASPRFGQAAESALLTIEALRGLHQVRPLERAEEGRAARDLPAGVYGYAYSPGLDEVPVFAQKKYHSFEVHKATDRVSDRLCHSRRSQQSRTAERGSFDPPVSRSLGKFSIFSKCPSVAHASACQSASARGRESVLLYDPLTSPAIPRRRSALLVHESFIFHDSCIVLDLGRDLGRVRELGKLERRFQASFVFQPQAK